MTKVHTFKKEIEEKVLPGQKFLQRTCHTSVTPHSATSIAMALCCRPPGIAPKHTPHTERHKNTEGTTAMRHAGRLVWRFAAPLRAAARPRSTKHGAQRPPHRPKKPEVPSNHPIDWVWRGRSAWR